MIVSPNASSLLRRKQPVFQYILFIVNLALMSRHVSQTQMPISRHRSRAKQGLVNNKPGRNFDVLLFPLHDRNVRRKPAGVCSLSTSAVCSEGRRSAQRRVHIAICLFGGNSECHASSHIQQVRVDTGRWTSSSLKDIHSAIAKSEELQLLRRPQKNCFVVSNVAECRFRPCFGASSHRPVNFSYV